MLTFCFFLSFSVTCFLDEILAVWITFTEKLVDWADIINHWIKHWSFKNPSLADFMLMEFLSIFSFRYVYVMQNYHCSCLLFIKRTFWPTSSNLSGLQLLRTLKNKEQCKNTKTPEDKRTMTAKKTNPEESKKKKERVFSCPHQRPRQNTWSCRPFKIPVEWGSFYFWGEPHSRRQALLKKRHTSGILIGGLFYWWNLECTNRAILNQIG